MMSDVQHDVGKKIDNDDNIIDTSANFGESIVPCSPGLKPAERSVSFNRDVHVKRIGRGIPKITTALAGNGDGKLVVTPVHKESISSRSKEQLAQEAELVLQQAGSLNCIARDNRRIVLPGKYNTLPSRPIRKKRNEHTTDERQNIIDDTNGEQSPITKRKKKKIDRSLSDAGNHKQKSPLAKLFSPKLERKNATVKRSVSDIGTVDKTIEKPRRKRSGSVDENTNTISSNIKKQLSPIIEASPQTDRPFDFKPKLKKNKEIIIPINTDDKDQQQQVNKSTDEVDKSSSNKDNNIETTIDKMIHHLSNDRSLPPQLTRTMVSPSSGFGHNNNRPFSYTRPQNNDDSVKQSNGVHKNITIIDKKTSQRSHSDSDEGLGLDRKDSSRENSPEDKDYHGISYNKFYNNTHINNEINNFDKRYDNKPDRYTSKIFVKEETNHNKNGLTSKTSELSARRDLLESRMKSRFMNDDLINVKKNLFKKTDEIIDKPIVPSPVIPNKILIPNHYSDTYITETRTKSNGEKYIYEKEIHDNNGKIYGFEKKINKLQKNKNFNDIIHDNGYIVEKKIDKNGDKYIIETKKHDDTNNNHDDYLENEFKPFISDKSRSLNGNNENIMKKNYIKSPVTVNGFIEKREFSKSEDYLDREPKNKPSRRDFYVSKIKKNLETVKGISKSSQRLDELDNHKNRSDLRSIYITRSHENLRLDDDAAGDYVNTRNFNVTYNNNNKHNDDYDTDISQLTNSHLGTNGYYGKENRRNQIRRYNDSERDYNSSRYDSDATGGHESINRRHEVRYRAEETSKSIRKDYRKITDDKRIGQRGSKNRIDYIDDSESTRDSSRCGSKTRIIKTRLETFDESPEMKKKIYHSDNINSKGDNDRKDRLADSGIENDYRRDSQENDRRNCEILESEDEGFVTSQFLKNERRHTDKNMNLIPIDNRRYEKYQKNSNNNKITTKPPSGINDKKYEKKTSNKKISTMSKVRQLFGKKEKKLKDEKYKKNKIRDHDGSSSGGGGGGGGGALTDDEVTMRYREYRGDRLRSAKSAHDLDCDIDEEYRERRRLSTPSDSPTPRRPARLSRSTGTLTHDDAYLDSSNTLTRANQNNQESKGWFKSLRKNKTNTKNVDKKSRIPESEIMMTGTEDEEVLSTPERISNNKNIRFCGDTDQESLSSHRDHHRNKRDDERVTSRRDTTSVNSNRHSILAGNRKTTRHAESALSSGESTTGDSSQQSQNSQRSQRSVVFLHAATVGEIPGPNERRRAASREELNRPLQSHTRTVSRSLSVLAPWKPRHYREPFEINYDQQYQKPTTTLRRRQRSRDEATLARRGKDQSRRTKDNLSKTGTINRSTLKTKDKQKVDRTISNDSLQNSRSSKNGTSRVELNRSTSVPRDPIKSAGWFRIKTKKSRA
ncbi:hypothetical protein HCN44_011153 [Aphidius gifuensis]|uniref:Uncharacterized protein n=1 Tax=Aphidius gifuensis TaxID=684658 RepID=A0A835CRE9_APHGI|nr:uncharacterized protein PFB0765w [Aphidius gifuensis]KAF7993884.1 hypothetical protein HCN44_011153 [Aphidius gifuensis]